MDKSVVRERWERGNDVSEDGVQVPRESSRHRRSRRDEKSCKDRERCKELEKQRVSSRKDRTPEKGRDMNGDFAKYRERNRERDRERKDHGKGTRQGNSVAQGYTTRREEKKQAMNKTGIKEKRNAEKERALHFSRVFDEQDNINQVGSEDEAAAQHTSHDLSGVKVLHGLDKVIQGGAVVLTLKDQTILANGNIYEDVDMLENVEICEQKQRDNTYEAAKRKQGTYEDKFNDDLGMEKKVLPQYVDPVADEGVTLDAAGRFGGEAKKKLDELRTRIDGVSTASHFEDHDSSVKASSDYYTHEEMLRFEKPKKQKSLRKKDKLELDALEAEAVSAGLSINDLGSRSNGKGQALKEEQEKSEAEKRSSAYQLAHARAEKASNALRQERRITLLPMEEDDDTVFGNDADNLCKSLERARKLALEKQVQAAPFGPQSIAFLTSSTATIAGADNGNTLSGETQENKVVFTEMEEFVRGLQLGEAPEASAVEKETEDDGWTEMQDIDKDEIPLKEKEEDKALDETIHEVAVGKGLSGVLNLLKERGALKESVELGGRNMDKKKSKLVGIYDSDGKTPKEAFRLISHKFHGKGPGKKKQENACDNMKRD